MKRLRFTFVLPVAFVLVTVALWYVARAQHLKAVCPPSGVCTEWGEGWTDYTPLSIQVAGMLSIPVAVFGHPLYGLIDAYVSKGKLISLLLGVFILWAYVGWRFDTRNDDRKHSRPIRIGAAILGSMLAALVLLETVTMFHVNFVYKAAGVVWFIVIVRHFLLPSRSSSLRILSGDMRLPRLSLFTVALCWAALLVAAAIVLPPPGVEARRLSLFFVTSAIALVAATAFAFGTYFFTAWRRAGGVPDKSVYVTWLSFESLFALAVVGGIIYVAVHG